MKDHLSGHILMNSATMAGVCMTVLALTKVLEKQTHMHTYVGEALTLNMVIFTSSALFSYISMRQRARHKLAAYYENLANIGFMLGLGVMTLCAVIFAVKFI